MAEDEANHLHAFEIISGSRAVYCATTNSRRMFEWIFALQHLKVNPSPLLSSPALDHQTRLPLG